MLHPELALFSCTNFLPLGNNQNTQCNSFKGVLPKTNAANSPDFEAKKNLKLSYLDNKVAAGQNIAG